MQAQVTTGRPPLGRARLLFGHAWKPLDGIKLVPPVALRLDDVLRLKKPHPCGSYDFVVVRLGADIGLRCQICGRRILLARSLLERRMTSFVSRGAEPELPHDIEPPAPP